MVLKRLLVAVGSGFLFTAAGNYDAALGVGDKTCDVWTSMRHGPQAEAAAQWFLGYISGLNVHTAPVAIMDEEGRGMLLPLDQVCGTRPKMNVMSAATALIQDEYKNRMDLLKRSGKLMDRKQ